MCNPLLSRTMMFMRATATLKKLLGPVQSFDGTSAAETTVTIRYARPDDALALLDLAAMDSSYPPHGVVLVAEVEGRLWAALSLEDGHTIADPFRPSGELSFLLAERARQIARTTPRDNNRLRRLTPSAA
jgi:hypothetical protein